MTGPAAAELRRAAGGDIDVAVILGSGFAEALPPALAAHRIPYAQLPGLDRNVIPGQRAEAFAGTWHGLRAVVFGARFHLYQGATPLDAVMPVRIAAAAGARTLFLTNAAGGLNPVYRTGDAMLIVDHLNLTGANPLTGTDPAEWGRTDLFVDMAFPYDRDLRAHAQRSAESAGVTLREGVYAAVAGPSYETPAETRMLRALGADAVGMSTVLETIAARALGLRVLGLSLITNAAAEAAGTTHEDVVAAGRTSAPKITGVLDAIVAGLNGG